MDLSNHSEKSLNKLTNVFSPDNYLKDINSNKGQRSNIFFTIKDDQRYFVFKTIYYEDILLNKESSYSYVKVKFEDLDTSNIEMSIQYLPYFGGKYGNVTINSKYNRQDVFIHTLVPINNDKPNIENKVGYFEILMPIDKAIEFEKQLKVFLNSF